MQNKTLSIKKPFGKTLGLTLIFLLLGLGLLEIFLRVGALQPYLSQLTPSLGGRHHQMELQLARMELLAENEGPVDCVLLGSSLVWLGVNPDVFEDAFLRETGQEIRCFTMGVETMPANAAAALASIIVQLYHPKLLIYGTSARDYAIDSESDDTQAIMETPWLQQQLGHNSFKGWLFTHSYITRYLSHFRSILRLDGDSLREAHISPRDLSGHLKKTRPAQDVHFQAAASDARKWLEEYEIQPENLVGLEELVDIQGNGLKVVVVEMPVNSTYYDYFSNGQNDYNYFVNQVEALLTAKGRPFLRTTNTQLIPNEGWWDRSHMNAVGAEIFSTWLGEQIGRSVKEGKFTYLSGK